jgi:hypothetical protein
MARSVAANTRTRGASTPGQRAATQSSARRPRAGPHDPAVLTNACRGRRGEHGRHADRAKDSDRDRREGHGNRARGRDDDR